MIHAQAVKRDIILNATSITNGATATSLQVDTLGFEQCSIELIAATSNATTRPLTLRLTESDDTVLTNFAGITQFTGTSNSVIGTSGFIIPLALTATTRLPFFVFNVNTQYRKRYLTLEVSGTTTQIFTAIATLSRANQMPYETTGMNVSGFVNG